MRSFLALTLALVALPMHAAEHLFDFSADALNQSPPGFRSLVVGQGKPGDWKVILQEVPPLLKPLTPEAPRVTRHAVLAQLAREPIERHFPLLIYEADTYGDFKLKTRFKIAGGALEQMAGIVFHYQNASNFFVVYADALGNAFRCTKMVDGEWKPPIGPAMEVSKGTWHSLTVQCDGTRIVCSLDGKEAIKLIDSADNRPGKIGFWTRADSVCYFADTKLTYTPQENPAQTLVRQTLEDYSRLLGLKIYAVAAGGKRPVVIASKDAKDLGKPGGKAEEDVIKRGVVYYGKTRHAVSVTVPLRNRNGDPIAAACITMKTFPGQTEDNAMARARPVVRKMQNQVESREDLLP